jgi:dienelactone hydrolase
MGAEVERARLRGHQHRRRGTDRRTQAGGQGGEAWKRHAWAGPARLGIYADSDQPLADQWIYHAVADTVLANSLLRSRPEVDAAQVGLMGISWGGVITSTVIGIDTRWAFAIPTYGCGGLADAANQYGQALGDNALYREVWDPLVRIGRARMPVLWLTWLKDTHFPLTAQSACYRAAGGPRTVAVLPDMGHSHSAGWNPPDSYAFAEAIVTSGKPWLRELSHARDAERGVAVAEFETAGPIERATLLHTADSGPTGVRAWKQTAAELTVRDGRVHVSAPLPADSRAWFFNVRRGPLTASSDFVEGP